MRLLLFAGLAIAVASCIPSSRNAWGQSGDEKPSHDKEFVEVDSIDVRREGAASTSGLASWKLIVKGKAPVLPAGTVIEFEVRLRSKVVDRFTVTLTATKRISAEHILAGVDGVARGLYLRWQVTYDLQSAEVRQEMGKKPEVFYVASSPWTDILVDRAFDLGVDKDFQDQDAQIKKYFSDRLGQVYEIEKQLVEKRKAILDKKGFMDGSGKLDTKAWRSWLERECQQPLSKMQAEIRSHQESIRFLSSLRDLDYLLIITKGTARLSVTTSREVYKASGLDSDPKDDRPENLSTNVQGKVTEKFFATRYSQLAASQEIINPRTGKLEEEAAAEEEE